jgi:hypothetical protein
MTDKTEVLADLLVKAFAGISRSDKPSEWMNVVAANLIKSGVRPNAAHDWVRFDSFFERCSNCGWGWKIEYDNDFPCPGTNNPSDGMWVSRADLLAVEQHAREEPRRCAVCADMTFDPVSICPECFKSPMGA